MRLQDIRLWLLIALTAAIRGYFTIVHRFDSDEPQHLHVAWGWAQGLVQYRDIFDNHLPLLHLLYAPLLMIVPESPDVLPMARWAIAPFAIACSWLVYLFAKPLFGQRAAVASALLFSVLAPWLPKSVEFRNDTLWIFFWLGALVLLTRRGRLSFLMAGLALGLSLLASIKAVPLLLAHVLVLVTLRRPVAFRSLLQLAVGMAIPIAVTGVAMIAFGALDEMIYGSFLFNASIPIPAWRRITGIVFFFTAGPLIALAWYRARFDSAGWQLALFTLWYVVVLLCFWPVVTERDFLPIVAPAAIGIAILLPERRWWTALTLAMALAIGTSFLNAEGWEPAEPRQEFIDAVVRNTAPGDYVFDLKGDSVFRRRPVYFIYDIVGRALTANGTLPDTGPELLAARGCCAAFRDTDHIPPRTRAFLNRHFVGNGFLRVCGTEIRGNTFEIGVPQTYAVVADNPGAVSIDGVPYRGPRALAAGPHTISTGGNQRVKIVWWRAARE